MHAEIKAELAPTVETVKREFALKRKAAGSDRARLQQLTDEFNDRIMEVDNRGIERLKDAVARERQRRGGEAGWGDSAAADRAQSRMGGFGDWSNGHAADFSDWGYQGDGQRASSAAGHARKASFDAGVPTTSLLSGTRPASRGGPTAYSVNGVRPASAAARPTGPLQDSLLHSTAKNTGMDEAMMRKFADEQARMDRGNTPATPSDQAYRKFAEEQARLHRVQTPVEIPRNEAQRRFADEQARLNRAHSPEITRTDTPSKSFSEDQMRILTGTSADTSRNGLMNGARPSPKSSYPSSSPIDSARLAAFAEQQHRSSQANLFAAHQDAKGINGTRYTQASQATRKSNPPPSARRSSNASMAPPSAMFGRFPLNEQDSRFDYDSNLSKVEVLFFDLDGTVMNWRGTVADELKRLGTKNFVKPIDWEAFATKWREAYLSAIRDLATNGDSLAPRTVYYSTLEKLLSKEAKELSSRWSPAVRAQLVQVWERIAAWPDVQASLKSIRGMKTVATLSNLPLRTQMQMNKHAGLVWDTCISASLLSCFKPSADAYTEAARHVGIAAPNCAIVSARAEELRIANSAGLKTVYVRRASEDPHVVHAEIASKLEGGEFDLVVDSFEHLAIVLGCD
ncbi:unnamed protein product [Mycena citricolor]|nr:unnamed protein product [Mycena citricolor]